MSKYHHILVAVDLSEHTEALMKAAAQMRDSDLSTEHATLSMVHVVEHVAAAYGGEFAIPVDAALEKEVETVALRHCHKLAERFKITEKHVFVRDGSVKSEVMEVASQVSADLIIVGSHLHTGIERLLGSRASGIWHLARCNVLSVRFD